MKKIFSIAMLAFVTNAFAQAPAIQWEKSLGGTSDEYANSVQITFDGGYIAAGYSLSNDGNVTGNHGMEDYWVVKLNASGIIQWQKSYGGTNNDVANYIQQTSDSGYIIAGYSESSDGDITNHHGAVDTADYWIVKINAAGVIQWQTSLGGDDYDIASSIQQTSDGEYIVAGYTSSTNGDVTANLGYSDYWIAKLSSAGNIQWQKSYGGSRYDYAFSIQQTTDGGFVVAGSSYSIDGDATFNHGLLDYWVIKLNATGIIQWQKSYGGSYSDDANYIRQTSDGGYIIGGTTYSYDGDVTLHAAPPEYWIVKTDSAGTIQWQKCFGGLGSDDAYAVEQTTDGGFIVAGQTASTDNDVTNNHGVWDCWVVKLNAAGVMQWQQCYGGPWDDGARMIHQTSDGGFIMAGHSLSTGGDVSFCNGGHDYWVVKLNGPVGMNETIHAIDFSVFPNPATNEINIHASGISTATTFSITDQAGRIVLTGNLENENTILSIDKLAPGVYVFQIGEQHKQFVKINEK